VGAHERQRDGRRGVGGPQGEGRPGEPVQRQAGHSHVGVLRVAEGQHRAVGERAHRGYPGVVGVEDGGAAGCQPLHELALGLGDGRAGPEVAEVGLADVGDDGDVGRGQAGERGDVAGAAGAHLKDEEPGGRAGAQHGERHAEFVVERAGRGDGRRGAREHGRQQVLGAGLAPGAGQPGDGQPVAQPGHDVGGERLQRGLGVRDDDGGQRRGPGAEYGHRAGPGGLDGVVVAVGVLAGEGDEKAARLGLSAVEHGRRGHRHGTVALDRPAGDRGDLAEAERDHAGRRGGRMPANGGGLTRLRSAEAGSR
jgi:hypothetical protein